MQYTTSVFLQTKGFALCDTESYRGPCHGMVMGESPGASFLRPSDRSAIWWSCDRGPVFLLCRRQPDTWWECAGERRGRGCQIVNTNTCSEVPCCLVCCYHCQCYYSVGLPWWLSWLRIRLQCRRPRFDSWVRKIRWRRDMLPTPGFLGFPGDSAGKESTCNGGDLGSIPGLGRSPGEGKGYPLQYSGLENSMDCIVHEVAKSRTRLSNFDSLIIIQ